MQVRRVRDERRIIAGVFGQGCEFARQQRARFLRKRTGRGAKRPRAHRNVLLRRHRVQVFQMPRADAAQPYKQYVHALRPLDAFDERDGLFVLFKGATGAVPPGQHAEKVRYFST